MNYVFLDTRKSLAGPMEGRRRTGMCLPSPDKTEGDSTNQLLSPKERRTSRQQ